MHVYRAFEKKCNIFFIATLKIEKLQQPARKFALEGNGVQGKDWGKLRSG